MTKKEIASLERLLAKKRAANSQKCALSGCHTYFVPSNSRNIYCCRKCAKKAKNYSERNRKRINGRLKEYNNKAGLNDRKELQYETMREKAIQASPNLKKLIPVPVNDGFCKFTIYAKKESDIQEVKERYLNRTSKR